jgi:toxin ParE1/3/4
MKIEYHPAVEQDLRKIIDYYEECSYGLGHEFLVDFERQILKIAANPKLYSVIENDIRRALMMRFPFCIYYRFISPGILRVTVVKHQRKHPNYGRKRI